MSSKPPGEGGICLTGPSIHPHFAPKDRLNNRKAPASPRTTRTGGADQEGHPGIVKARGGGGRDEEGTGAGCHYLVHRKGRKDRKGFYCPGFSSFAAQYFINNIF